MTERYVSFEIARLLKEKGFDEQCIMFYNNNELVPCVTLQSVKENASCAFNSWLYKGDYAAPTHQLVLKWLREAKNFLITISPCACNLNWYYPTVYYLGLDVEGGGMIWKEYYINRFGTGGGDFFAIYEDAEEAAIKYVLENLL